MRALANFIMRGRMQASLVALVGNLVPMVSPAALGLVTLRRGLGEGLLVLLWACLPLLAVLFLSSASHLVVMTSIVGMVVVLVAADVLKGTVSWQLTLVTVLVCCAAALLMLGLLLGTEAAQVIDDVQRVMLNLDGQPEPGVSPFYILMAVTATSLGIEVVNMNYVLGFLSWLTGLNVIASLLLARWWQSLLYNPGGFQQEFHGLRFHVVIASALMLAVVACNLLPADYMTWASMVGMPLLLSGISFAHFSVKLLGLGTVWLVVMYVGLIIFSPLSMVLIAVGFLDSFLDFRNRLARSRG
ncbi:MAG: hypothetical protein AB7U63_05180 [Porticoccaceae bacterium]